jgi:hypothetical protein
VLNELFHLVTPVRSTLTSVDGLGAVSHPKTTRILGPDSYTTYSRCTAKAKADRNRKNSLLMPLHVRTDTIASLNHFDVYFNLPLTDPVALLFSRR